MHTATAKLLRQALLLPSHDRAALIDGLMVSLDRPEPPLDALWVKEAEDRMEAYRSGELGAVDADQVFADLGRKG